MDENLYKVNAIRKCVFSKFVEIKRNMKKYYSSKIIQLKKAIIFLSMQLLFACYISRHNNVLFKRRKINSVEEHDSQCPEKTWQEETVEPGRRYPGGKSGQIFAKYYPN